VSTPLAIGAVAALAAASRFTKRGSGAQHLDDWDRSSQEGWVNQVASLLRAGKASAARSVAAEGGWSRANPIPMGGSDLTSLRIEQEDLRFLNLSGTLLARSNLSYCTLPNQMSGTDLTEAILVGVHARNVNFHDAWLLEADLAHADLRHAVFDTATLEGVNFTSAYLSGADLSESDLTSADFTDANLEGANLTNTFLPSAQFQGANLKGTNLTRAEGFDRADGIESGVNRLWVGAPEGYTIQRSRLSDRSILAKK
jgi:hypothetical protein